MPDNQQDIFNNSRVPQQGRPSPETLGASAASDPRTHSRPRRGLFDFLASIQSNFVRILTLLGVIGLLMEMFLPNALQPSTFFANRIANSESKKLIGTQRAIADAESLKAFEVGDVQNALAEQQAHLVNELTAQIDRANQCETQKLQLANQTMMECLTKEKGTFTACQATQMMLTAQSCPPMPEMTAQTKALLAKYRNLKKDDS